MQYAENMASMQKLLYAIAFLRTHALEYIFLDSARHKYV